mgnify:CR=1 FL=1
MEDRNLLKEEDILKLNTGNTVLYGIDPETFIPVTVVEVLSPPRYNSLRVWAEVPGGCEERLVNPGGRMLLFPGELYSDRCTIPAERF